MTEEKDSQQMVSTEDRLEAENLSLRLNLCIMKKKEFVDHANRKIEEFDRELTMLYKSVKEVQGRLSEKYAIDFRTRQIESGTGKIIPVPTNTVPEADTNSDK